MFLLDFMGKKNNFYKKKSFRAGFYGISAFLISVFLSYLALGSRYGFGDYLPQFYLFENPLKDLGNDRYGDIIERYLLFLISIPLFFLICYIFSIIDSAGEKVLKDVKKDFGTWKYIIPFFLIIFPWFLILADYITISIGYIASYNPNSYFPTGQALLFGLSLLISFVFSKK